ncbi:MAG: hypothetical protein HZA31_03115 [Opitutae bacterium]|nr:hypothetical protein [Opitutae bacterium]
MTIALYLVAVAQFYIPGKGFSYLISFGSKNETTRIAALRQLNYYVEPDSDGYDAQYYAQIAMDPTLRAPDLKNAIDSLPYRARRIFFSATAYVSGCGRPAWILQAYALQNVVCWLLLAGVLCHWFPPTSWGHFGRWLGVLASFGLCVSVRNALVDGPSLLLLALGAVAIERGRSWLGTAILGVSGLGKETNLLGAAALLRPEARTWAEWRRIVFQGILVGAPLFLWLIYLRQAAGPVADLGARNFDWPLVAFARKWAGVLPELMRAETWQSGIASAGAFWSLLMLVAVTVQFGFLVLRPQPQAPLWRIGISFAVLMLVLGDAVWEGFPGAASRVLLPLQLAFNVLVPGGRRWWLILVLGNLTMLNAPIALEPPSYDGCRLDGPGELLTATDGRQVRVRFESGWYDVEHQRQHYWRWSQGDAVLRIDNPHAFPVEARLRCTVRGAEARTLRILDGSGAVRWQGAIAKAPIEIEGLAIHLLPGENRLRFVTDKPPVHLTNDDPRLLAFYVKDCSVDVQRTAAP